MGSTVMTETDPKKRIPLPPIVEVYNAMRKRPQKEQLEWALEAEREPGELTRCVAESIETFSSYENVNEPFHPKHKTLSQPAAITTGHELERALATGGPKPGKWNVPYGTARIPLEFVAYELPPARTTTNSPGFLNEFEDGRDSLYVRTDLLLKGREGVPVVGEAKVAKEAGYDSTPIVALVQALAGGALLATSSQLRRLSQHHGTSPDAEGVELALISYKPTKLAASTYQRRLDAVAWMLAHRLVRHGAFPTDRIRRVHFIEAAGPPEALDLRAWAVEPS
jgi:hypothetical protein